MLKAEAQAAQGRSRSTPRKWRIVHKLTFASVLMILLTVVAGGVGLWQVLTIGQAVGDMRKKEQQLSWSLELLAGGYRLVAALDRMVLTEDPLLASTETPISLGTLSFYMGSLQASDPEMVGEIQVAHERLRQAVHEIDLLVRQESWTDAGVAFEGEVRPANAHMGLLVRRLVRQADRDVKAVTLGAQSAVQQAALRLSILVALTTAIAWGWRRFVFRELSRSITELRQGVARISSGDLEYKLDLHTGDEIEELGGEFNNMASELADVVGNLEQRVTERTAELAARSAELEAAHQSQVAINRQLEEAVRQSQRRAALLQTSAEVSRAVSQIRDLDLLLPQVTQLISQHFGFYHVGIFLVDEADRYAVLRAANSEGGQRMLAQGHRLAVGSQGIVGHVTGTGRPRITLDVGADAFYFDNPDLPHTRSEMAVPLRVGDEIIGALDVQSTAEAAFDQEDIAALEALADQVAIAIENVRLLQQTQAALEEVQHVQRRYLQQEWSQLVHEEAALSHEYTLSGVPPAGDAPPGPEAEAAWRRGELVAAHLGTLTDQDGTAPLAVSRVERRAALAAPIKVLDETIGVLDLHETDGERIWSEDEIALVQAVADQLGQALESARLFEQTQSSLAETRTLFQTSRRLAAAQAMDEVWQAVIDATRQRQSDACGLFLFDTLERERACELVLVAGWDRQEPPRMAIGTRLPLRDFDLFHTLRPDQPFPVPDLDRAEDVDAGARHLMTSLGFKALLHQPIAVRGQWFGLLTVLHGSPHAFTQAETDFYRALSDQAALAIEGQRLLGEARRRAEREQLIRHITEKVHATPNIETILHTTVQELSKALGLPRAFVRLGTEEELSAAPHMRVSNTADRVPEHSGADDAP
jgi:GAF domain-containing protein/HAMP domain-containing protein